MFDCLRVNHVSFKIGDTKEFILEDININFEKNKKYAIVGSSGSGKTTLLRLISDLSKATSGRVLINENDVSKSEAWKQYTSSYIDKNFFRFIIIYLCVNVSVIFKGF